MSCYLCSAFWFRQHSRCTRAQGNTCSSRPSWFLVYFLYLWFSYQRFRILAPALTKELIVHDVLLDFFKRLQVVSVILTEWVWEERYFYLLVVFVIVWKCWTLNGEVLFSDFACGVCGSCGCRAWDATSLLVLYEQKLGGIWEEESSCGSIRYDHIESRATSEQKNQVGFGRCYRAFKQNEQY